MSGRNNVIRLISNKGSAENIKRSEQRISLDLIKSIDKIMLPIPLASKQDWDLLKWVTTHATGTFSEIAEGQVGEVDQTFFASHMRDDKGEILVRGCHLSPFSIDLEPTPSKQRFIHENFFLEQKGESSESCLKKVMRDRVVQLGIRNIECKPRLVASNLSQKA